MYKFKLETEVTFQTDLKGRTFKSEWIELKENGDITIPKKYAWDGCTPKFNFLDLTFGTPDGRMVDYTYPITYFASLLHDAIYQYKKSIPITRKEADKLFYKELAKENFKLKYVYYFTVRALGWIVGRWKKKKTNTG